MGNPSGDRRKQKMKHRKKETLRLIAKDEAAAKAAAPAK